MRLNKHQIYRDIYDCCQIIEKLPASELQTKIVTMVRELDKLADKLVDALRSIKLTALTTTDSKAGLAHIIRLCGDVGITQHLDELISAEWNPTLVADIVTNCRQQIEQLRMKMPIGVALALARANEELAVVQAEINTD